MLSRPGSRVASRPQTRPHSAANYADLQLLERQLALDAIEAQRDLVREQLARVRAASRQEFARSPAPFGLHASEHSIPVNFGDTSTQPPAIPQVARPHARSAVSFAPPAASTSLPTGVLPVSGLQRIPEQSFSVAAAPNIMRPKITQPKYNGERDPIKMRTAFRSIRTWMTSQGFCDGDRFSDFAFELYRSCLGLDQQAYIDGFPDLPKRCFEKQSWEPVESVLSSHYADLAWRDVKKREFQQLKQDGAHMSDYVQKFKELSDFIGAGTFSHETLKDTLRDGLDPDWKIELLKSSVWRTGTISEMQDFLVSLYSDYFSAQLVKPKAFTTSSRFSSSSSSDSWRTRAPAGSVASAPPATSRPKSSTVTFQKSPNYDVLSPSSRMQVLRWQARFPPGSALLPPKKYSTR